MAVGKGLILLVTMTTSSLTFGGCTDARGVPSNKVVPHVWEELGAEWEELGAEWEELGTEWEELGAEGAHLTT